VALIVRAPPIEARVSEAMIETVSQNLCFGGVQSVYTHAAHETGCAMRFGIFLPPQANSRRVPVLYWLSGLTCTEENFIVKAGAQRTASELGLAIVVPDTSPRGLGIQGEGDSYDFGLGAGFYVDATESPWSAGYRMYSYVAKELPAVVRATFPIDPTRVGIFGHSMGGHGALTIALKNPHVYKSVSALAPIASPTRCPWGQKALTGYLGPDTSRWREYDATALIEDRGWTGPHILVDQGTNDQFLGSQLRPELLQEACRRSGVSLDLRLRNGYDHSYFFIASFIEDHLRFHAANL
jgi:S-formylglutathione hydrolase